MIAPIVSSFVKNAVGADAAVCSGGAATDTAVGNVGDAAIGHCYAVASVYAVIPIQYLQPKTPTPHERHRQDEQILRPQQNQIRHPIPRPPMENETRKTLPILYNKTEGYYNNQPIKV